MNFGEFFKNTFIGVFRDKRKVISLINVYKSYTIKEKEIFELLKNLSKNGKCIIVVSHSSLVK